MNILVTVCARKGSKGVPGKNIRTLNGKPLIAHTLTQAKAWGKAKRIVVSTDGDEIARIAAQYGAEIPNLRPVELAQDDTPKIDVIRHTWRETEKTFNESYDVVVDLDVTAPMRTIGDLEKCYELFLKHTPMTLFSVVSAHRNPYFNMVEVNGQGFARLCKELPKGVHSRQKAPRVYDMNASIYFYSRDFMLSEDLKSPLCEKSIIYEMGVLSGYDIDREIDFKFIEFLMQQGSSETYEDVSSR